MSCLKTQHCADVGMSLTSTSCATGTCNDLFDLIIYIPSTIFQLNRDRSSWVEQVLS